MLRSVASDLGVCYLQRPVCSNTQGYYSSHIFCIAKGDLHEIQSPVGVVGRGKGIVYVSYVTGASN